MVYIRLHRRPPRTTVQITNLINIARRRVKLSRRDHTKTKMDAKETLLLSAGRCDYGNTDDDSHCPHANEPHKFNDAVFALHITKKKWAVKICTRLGHITTQRESKAREKKTTGDRRVCARLCADRPTYQSNHIDATSCWIFHFFIVRSYRLMLPINFRLFYCWLGPSFRQPIYICFYHFSFGIRMCIEITNHSQSLAANSTIRCINKQMFFFCCVHSLFEFRWSRTNCMHLCHSRRWLEEPSWPIILWKKKRHWTKPLHAAAISKLNPIEPTTKCNFIILAQGKSAFDYDEHASTSQNTAEKEKKTNCVSCGWIPNWITFTLRPTLMLTWDVYNWTV